METVGYLKKYRPEVDGLRAIAIIFVFIFHINAHFMPGGFIGVDVFFVISGYLITNVLLQDLKIQGTINFTNFYNKRIKRIIPSILLVCLISWITSFLIFLPTDFYSFSKSAISTLSFSSNFYFSKKVDYFSPSAEEIPLLHTWSLSIEEQFYLIWPLTLGIIWKIKKPLPKQLIVLLFAILSLLYSQWLIGHAELSSQAYYSPLSRAFELLIGCLASLFHKGDRQRDGAGVSQLTNWLGILLITSSAVFFSLETDFPGYYALVPTLGTFLLINGSYEERSLLSSFLKNKLFVWIGQHSYSIYLWHWPVLAFYRYAKGGTTFSSMEIFCLISLTLILSAITRRFWELPLYHRKDLFIKSFFRTLVLPSILLWGFFYFTIKSNLHVKRIANSDSYTKETEFLPAYYCHNTLSKSCVLINSPGPKKRILLIGDSHAAHYTTFLQSLYSNQSLIFFARTIDSCPPVIFPTNKTKEDISRLSNWRCIDHLEGTKRLLDDYEEIILASDWISYFKNYKEFEISFQKTIIELKRRNKKIIVMARIPTLDKDLFNKYIRAKYALLRPHDPKTLKQALVKSLNIHDSKEVNLKLKSIAKDVYVFDLMTLMSDIKQTLPFSKEIIMYKDATHLNHFGSLVLAQEYKNRSSKCKTLECGQ